MTISVRVVGLDALQAKLKDSVLLEPQIEEARDTIVARMLRGGKGAGVRNNQLTPEVRSLGATITSTLKNPRQTGVSWQRKNEAIVKSMGPSVVRRAIERIEAAI